MKTYICIELEEGENIECAEINCAHLVFSEKIILKDRYNLAEKIKQANFGSGWFCLLKAPEDTIVDLLIASASGSGPLQDNSRCKWENERIVRGFFSNAVRQWFDDKGNKIGGRENFPLFWKPIQ